jgi:putative flippase GtrA
MVLGFKLHGSFVFGHSGRGRFLRFAMIFISMYILSLGIQTFARRSVNGYLAGAIASCVTVPVSYLLNRTFVFHLEVPDAKSED